MFYTVPAAAGVVGAGGARAGSGRWALLRLPASFV